MSRVKSGINRRRFIRLGALGGGMAVTPPARSPAINVHSVSSGEMRYRPLGKTGLEVSEISFGTYGFNNPALLEAALDAGINLICTCADYQDGAAERAVAKALKSVGGRRDQLIILTGATIRKGRSKEEILSTLDSSLQRLDTDHVEIFKTHNIDDPAQIEVEELYEAFTVAKQQGKALHLAVSGHGRNLSDCLRAALEKGSFEAIHCRYDFMSYREEQEKIFQEAVRRGMGNIVFKVKAGERQDEIKDFEKNGLSFTQATAKWALANSDVSSLSAGITSFDQINEYCGAVGAPLEEAELQMLQQYASLMHNQYCRNCGSCEASCPKRVPVADIMRFAMYFKYYGMEKESMRLYAKIPERLQAAACLECGEPCRSACPHRRDIRSGLLEAHEMLV